ncbi:TolC family protein [Massilia sp. G4R7]|uniref:TolC family protein n=1 Tax=Massilia phyllostachyos TaxID=2898585 RepID=A0ABS8Q4R4_9BURK|nr:TolC family protein [Massilia phyllostachyos]MCD2516743.1 TolC family protein [Massilia phyllostachyos]
MHLKYYVLGAAALFAQTLPAAAQVSAQPAESLPSVQRAGSPGAALTLDQAIAKAFAANPGLRAAALDIAIAAGARRQAGVFPNPEVSFVREGTQRGTRTQTVQLSQVLELGGKRSARIKLADSERSLAAGNLDVARTDLRAEVTTAYFDALAAQERAQLAQASLDVASKAAGAASKRVAAGRVSPLEEDRASVAQAGARVDLAQAQSEWKVALTKLAAYWGDTSPAPASLAIPELDLAPAPALDEFERRLENLPQMRRARLQVQREQAQVGVDRAQRMPDLTLIVGSKKDDEIGRSQTVLGISVPLPLFNRNQGSLQASLARSEKAQAELEAERVRLRQELASTHQRAQLAREQVRTMREEILPAAQRVFDKTVTGFEAGKFGFLDVLEAQRTLLSTRTQYLQVLYERYRALADLGRYASSDAGTLPDNRNTP